MGILVFRPFHSQILSRYFIGTMGDAAAAISVIAQPLANDKLAKKALKLVKKGNKLILNACSRSVNHEYPSLRDGSISYPLNLTLPSRSLVHCLLARLGHCSVGVTPAD